MSEKQKIVMTSWGVVVAIFALMASRLLPHPDNFTPMIAAALFGGAYFSSARLAFAVPLLAMLFSDMALEMITPAGGFHSLMVVVYGCFAGFVGLGFLLRKYQSKMKILAPALMAVAASTLFFLISNFAVWLTSGFYPLTLGGLLACYIAALPFYGNGLAGDLFWTVSLFGLWRLASARFGFAFYQRAV